ncbi:hypothetical protein SAMN05421858_2828 [Haladaptatus litoreus]|uniref:RecA-superfamily ATPase, KaiC/GvpD/RAD55 family n=1 Tax=Haladaptatus litoreus TaxID=553468 RepID=A0A1N7BXV9_9EURY|nr:ATPase involved in flagella biogenesis [Haladaptatus litoreus]SIR56169.1 hypothetical protein SAMN05421858_2828 [Haladaptatus litoreus]
MDYQLAIENTPDTVPGGTGILLLHPSTGETDRIDTDFLKTDTDRFLVISTRTTAREVKQKLDHYDVDESKADILDTLSIERGYSRRSTNDVHYVSAPDNLEGILSVTEKFLAESDGKRRISFDSITEMAYYADEQRAYETVSQVLSLLSEHDAVGLFHLSKGVHDEVQIERFLGLFEAVVDLDRDGNVDSDFPETE